MGSFKEIQSAVLSWRIWLSIAFEDVVGRYRRTLLGPIWIVLGQSAFIFGIYLVRQAFSNGENEKYLLFLAISIPLWNLIAAFMQEGSSSLLRSKGYIESYPLPLPIFIVRSVAAAVVNFFHVLIVFVIICAFYAHIPSLSSLLFFPAICITILFGLGLALGLAPLGARFRDVGAAITSLIGLLFVVTPIFWIPTPEQLVSPIVRFNPFFYFLEMVRQPLLNGPIEPHVWIVSIALSLASLIFGFILYKLLRPTVVYWI